MADARVAFLVGSLDLERRYVPVPPVFDGCVREIERRREIVFARSLRGAVQQAEDAEFTIVEPASNQPIAKADEKAA